MLKVPDFQTQIWYGCGPYTPAAFIFYPPPPPLQEIFLVRFFCLRLFRTQKHSQLKITLVSPGVEPETLRLVAQCLIHLRPPYPKYSALSDCNLTVCFTLFQIQQNIIRQDNVISFEWVISP